MIRSLMLALALTLVVQASARAQMSALGWTAAPASGVEMRLSDDAGAIKVDFDFHGGGGWAAFRKDTTLQLPENYEFTFRLKADAPTNTLEFKLVDASGENVWWVRRPDFGFAGDWRTVRFRKRHIEFAWGPKGGGEIEKVAAIEFAITAGTGGKGTVWIDDLTLTPRPPVRTPSGPPVVTRTANSYTMDLREPQEYGGLAVQWHRPGNERSYDVQISSDARAWETVRSVRSGRRSVDLLQLPETESRYLRLLLLANDSVGSIRDVRVEPLAFGAARNRLFERLAATTSGDAYPAYFRGTQTYWTVVGNPGERREALINEYGAIEVDKQAFSLEPFLYQDGALIGWSAAESTTLEAGYLPIPSVLWRRNDVQLRTTVWSDAQALWVRYRVTNTGAQPASPTLYVALRPFQVNPPAQFLNFPGGVAPIWQINFEHGRIAVDDRTVTPITRSAAFGAVTFDQGDITDYLRKGTLPPARTVRDSAAELASAALAYPLQLAAHDSADVYLAIPLHNTAQLGDASAALAASIRSWRAELDRFQLRIPAAPDLGRALRANLGYILINQDGPAIQPGSRSYERSWIRDGSLTSAALLRLGQNEPVKRFIEWYAPFQYADGKVPCCVDQRGADPVPENDSHGQLIYLIAEYFRYTGDSALVRRTWPHVERAVAYMDSLRQSRRTEQYRGTGFWGMLPQSISHEGYSAKPMHSYWDDFFALKGFKDAAWLAHQFGSPPQAQAWARMRDEFNADLMSSFRWTMQKHNIDYLAGAVELGDFDATSTTVGLNPAGAQRELPQDALRRTFERYWEDFVLRRANWAAAKTRPDTTSRWSAYTPYEWRVVGALVRLGERKRAHEVAEWFMQHRRPTAWNHWAEVVYRDARAARFIGDMPHTWVGSDFIRSVLDMFVYDDEDALTIGAGIAPEWITSGDTITVAGLRTPYGPLAYRVFSSNNGRRIHFRFDDVPREPRNGFVVRSTFERPIRGVRADGRTVPHTADGVRLRALPRELVLSY
ncbi:MAG TPA: hypothetical protein VGD27_03480 [Longimicrobiales bacterium]